MKKFISVLLASVLLCAMFAACSKKDDEASSVNVTVTITADGTNICENESVTVKGSDGNAPVALDAVLTALDQNEITWETGELAGHPKLDKIGDYDTENNKYIWDLYINDKEASSRIHAAEIKDGDKITIIRNEGVVATDTTDAATSEAETTEAVKTADDGYED